MMKGQKRRFYIPIFLIAVLLLALYLVVGLPLRGARAKWREGHYGEAILSLQQWRRLHLRPAEYDEALAVIYLSAGRGKEAEPLLASAKKFGPQLFSFADESEVGRRLISEGRYNEYLDYARSVEADDDDMLLYSTAALVGGGKVAEAKSMLARVDEDDVDENEYAAVRDALQEISSGSFRLLTDGDRKTLAVRQLSSGDVVAVNRDFASLIEREAGTLTVEAGIDHIGSKQTIETTLDSDIQRKALFALGGFSGSLVVIDVERNEIVAVANADTSGKLRNRAFEGSYEPGSVIKVLTTLAAVDGGFDFNKLFPFQCEGVMTINGRLFYDWARHDRVGSLDDALATSCNLSFARMGITLGADRMSALFKRARFGESVDLGLFRVPLGKQTAVLSPDYALGSAACGLEIETINALHLAMLSNAVARGGAMSVPRLVRSRRSLLGDEFPAAAPHDNRELASQRAVAVARQAMKGVVTHPRGTGRRAAVEGLQIAMKTGTAGTRDPGYNALVMAFAPADKPRYAIGIIAEHAGPAEIAGAKIAHDFFAQLFEK